MLIVIAIIAITFALCFACSAAGTSKSTEAPPAARADPLMDAGQYFDTSTFFSSTRQDDTVSFAVGSSDPAFDNRLPDSTVRTSGAFASTCGGEPQVRLEPGLSACAGGGGVALQIVDGIGERHGVQLMIAPQPAESQVSGEGSMPVDAGVVNEAARAVARLADDLRPRQFNLFSSHNGRERMQLLLAPADGSSMVPTLDQPPVTARLGLVDSSGFTASVDPDPLSGNGSIERVRLTIGRATGKPGLSPITVCNLVWRRSGVIPDCGGEPENMSGGDWTVSQSLSLTPAASLSAAASEWRINGDPHAGAILTGEYRASSAQAFGIGIFQDGFATSPFASYARTLPAGGRLFVSVDAPLDYTTHVPVSCRMIVPF
ncbi:MAG: hypothetical protein ACLQVD_22190 [Capsulimonadaceae bacterium]